MPHTVGTTTDTAQHPPSLNGEVISPNMSHRHVRRDITSDYLRNHEVLRSDRLSK